MRPRRSELHTLAGAYAMDAVPVADRARFERHLAACRPCARELQGLREATTGLAMAAAARPPERLIERTMDVAARTLQLPPTAIGRPAWARAQRRLAPRRRPHPSHAPTALRSPRKQAIRPRLALALVITFLAP